MTHTKHTPDHWEIGESLTHQWAPIIWDNKAKRVVCDLYYETKDGGYGTYDNLEVNAHLIAAAPDLLKAAENARAWLLNIAQPKGHLFSDIIEALESAIAKATQGSE